MMFGGKMSNYLEQERRAARLMNDYRSYALETGCEVFQDEIIADKDQSALLAQRWKELTV